MLYFCNKTKSFYDSEIRKHIPDGCVKITKEQHTEILEKLNSRFSVDYVDGEFRFSEIEISKEQKESSIRKRRDFLISSCDWTILPDSPLSTEKKKEWKSYRQQLRDITTQEGFPENVVFPEKPE